MKCFEEWIKEIIDNSKRNTDPLNCFDEKLLQIFR